MKDILDRKNKGEDFEAQYVKLCESRKRREIYTMEQKLLIEKQLAMQQNFIKMIDKNINDMEKDHNFLDLAEKEIHKDEGDNAESGHHLYGAG
jgi:hypothetical protein